MIKVVEERLCDTVKATGVISDEYLINAINRYAMEAGISVTVEKDQIKVGSGLFVKSEPCIAVYNSQFKSKYYNYDIVQRQQGNYVFISMYMGGDSANYKKKVLADNAKKNGSFFMGGLMGPNHKKHQEEYAYYDIVKQVIGNAIYSSGVILK